MRIIKNFFRNVFRYKLTAIFFIIGQLIMYITILGALGIYNKAYQKETDRINSQYKNRIEMNVVKLNKSEMISDCGDGIDTGNVILRNVSLFFGERGSTNRKPEIIISMNEADTYEMVSGRLPGTVPEDNGKQVVALGRGQYEYAYEDNGKCYATFENERYEVVGVIGNKGSDYLDYAIVFNADCLGTNVKTAIKDKKEYKILIGSNQYELNDTYKSVYNNIIKLDSNAAIESKSISGKGESTLNATMQKENIKINLIVYIFCIVNCMLMSEFWIIERNKEFAIRRTYGYGQLKLIGGIAKDILVLGVVSLMCYALIHIIIANLIGVRLYEVKMDIKLVFMIVLINVTALVATLIKPVYRLMKMNPAVILEDIE